MVCKSAYVGIPWTLCGVSGKESMISCGVGTDGDDIVVGREGVGRSTRNLSIDLACSANQATVLAKRSKLDYEATNDLSLLLWLKSRPRGGLH